MLAGTQLIQLKKFVCIIPTQNSTINLRCKTALQSPLTTYLGKGSDAILFLHHNRMDVDGSSNKTRANRAMPPLQALF